MDKPHIKHMRASGDYYVAEVTYRGKSDTVAWGGVMARFVGMEKAFLAAVAQAIPQQTYAEVAHG